MGKSLYVLLVLVNSTFSWLPNKFLEFPKSKVSFVAKIDDLYQDNVRLSREISKWERRIATKSKERREAKLEASELKVII